MTYKIDKGSAAYCDGACLGNPGRGGWASLIIKDGVETVITGQADGITTNNIMELTAAIKTLENILVGEPVIVYSDSNYVIQGVTTWIKKWKLNGWRTYDRKPVANQELWQLLDTLNSERSVLWIKVKGHSGHPENERVDALANAEAQKAAQEASHREGSHFGLNEAA
jgi:ribonuclease HI